MKLINKVLMKPIVSCLLVLVFSGLFAVPFCPDYKGNAENLAVYPSQRFYDNSRGEDLPDNLLVLLIEFEDVKFISEVSYPDFLVHDKAYFSKYLEHLSEYYRDQSHGKYPLSLDNFTIYENIITVPNTMAFYGSEELKTERVCTMVSDAVDIVDSEIDFSLYDGFIIFHAGAGQEADLTGQNADGIISTFLTRKSFQSGLDPENDDYQGLETDDGTYLNEFVVCPETEWQPDNDVTSPIYNMYGVLAHHFGHLIGLPTLFDNRNSNGLSRGIGGFGIMGIGAWIANGYVPAPLCAWSRYYLGWEDDLVEIEDNSQNLKISYPNAADEETKLYKINISESEYFLIENHQQNPDNSTFVNVNGDTLVSFTFPLAENQQYYPDGHPYAGQPKFNFMENSYEGCEWSFYLPGYGDGDNPAFDGSGLLIWHIDELVLEEKFSPGFEKNHPNGDAAHKAVDLEEADGVQHLDGINTFFGGKDDSFRAGNNTYFGKQFHDKLFSSPTSDSYYGGNRVEILNISVSDTVMSFDVNFEWSLKTDYSGMLDSPVAVIDFDSDGENEIFYPMPNGENYIWKDDQIFVQTSQFDPASELSELYAWDELSKKILLPYSVGDNACYLYSLSNEDGYNQVLSSTEYSWAAAPVINNDATNQNRVLLPMTALDKTSSIIRILDANLQELTEVQFDEIFISNLMLKDNTVAVIDSLWKVQKLDLNNYIISEITLEIGEKKEIDSALWVDIDADKNLDFIVTTADSSLYCYHHDGSLFDNFPVKIPLQALTIPSLADMSKNGFLDVIYGGENSFCIIDKEANISKPEYIISSPDSIFVGGGVIAADVNNDNQLEIIGSMSRNKLCIWEKISDNNYEIMAGYPIAFQTLSTTYPVLAEYADYANSCYYAAADGAVYKQEISGLNLENITWKVEFGNLQRTASYLEALPKNQFEDETILIEDKIYFYPNPLNAIFGGSIFNGFYKENVITLNLLTSQDANVTVSIFDVAGNKLLKEKVYCAAYIQNGFFVDASKLSSGVYFAVIKTGNEVLKKKFAIEK
ncbi:MAG: T9SS type A sorting domain-containing protein [Candidatus Cloacimonetes bacterium]|nr:T9SS type A sorting domain-containing protein [Candidatus Cloacimonadota bacterium]